MSLSNIYNTTLSLVDNSTLVEAIYKVKEAALSDENKLRLADWLSFFNENREDFKNLYSGTIYAMFNALTDKELILQQSDVSFENSKEFYLKISKSHKLYQPINTEQGLYLLNLALIYGVYSITKIKTIEESINAIEHEINEDTVFKFFLNLFVKDFYHCVLPKTSINLSIDELYRFLQDVRSSNGRTTIEKNARAHTLILSTLHYISEMDIEMIDEILPSDIIYSGLSKKNFIYSLGVLFNEFKNFGDTHFIQFRGIGTIGKRIYPGYTFIGNNSKNYINIIIKFSKNAAGELDLVDIFDCPSFKNSLGVLKLNKQLKINTDLFKNDLYNFL